MKHKKLSIALIFVLMLAVLFTSCIQGERGAQGPKGEKGDTGATGAQGPKGDKGDTGETGKSAFELYRDTYGYDGTEEEWLADLLSGALVTYTVTFDLNGGEGDEGFASSVKVPAGGYLHLSVPTKAGHTFVGWYTGDAVTDGMVTSTTAIRSDMSLKARWHANSFSVKFLGENGILLKEESVTYGESAQAPAAPVVEGFVFDKWDADFSSVTENMTVNAVYVAETYTLSYNTDGGDELADEVYRVGDIPVKPATPYKGGYSFVGWYLDADFVTPYDFSTGFNADTTIYAYFLESIPISTAEELKAIGDYSTGKYHLTQNISLDGTVWTPLWYFEGELDGRGYQISDFVISSGDYLVGFFATNNGTIKNLTLSDFAFSVSTVGTNITFSAGSLVGTNSGTVENCHIKDATLTYHYYKSGTGSYSSYAGGIVGCNDGVISNCSVEAYISCCSERNVNSSVGSEGAGKLYLGGAVGKNVGTITCATSNTNVDGNAKGTCGHYNYAAPIINIGGFVSTNEGEILFSNGNITIATTSETTDFVMTRIHFGGFVYENIGVISKCFAEGSFDGTNSSVRSSVIGGFVANNEKQITDCYTNVKIKTTNALAKYADESRTSGFVALNNGTIASCYTTSTITSAANCPIGGFVGRNQSGGIISKSFASCDITYTGAPSAVCLFVGVADDGGTLFKNYYNAESKILQGENDVTVEDSNATATDLATLQSKAFLIDTLGWNAEIWEVIDGKHPVLIAIK